MRELIFFLKNNLFNLLINLITSIILSITILSVSNSNIYPGFILIENSQNKNMCELINGNNNFEIATLSKVVTGYGDSTQNNNSTEKKKSDLFYYILGIFILIAAGFILKQRYEQYLKQRDNL